MLPKPVGFALTPRAPHKRSQIELDGEALYRGGALIGFFTARRTASRLDHDDLGAMRKLKHCAPRGQAK